MQAKQSDCFVRNFALLRNLKMSYYHLKGFFWKSFQKIRLKSSEKKAENTTFRLCVTCTSGRSRTLLERAQLRSMSRLD
jgi:hypothetical protein